MTKDALEISEWFKNLQDRITTALEIADGKGKFRQDLWDRSGGGGGRTRIIQNGAIIEKGGVNFSAVHGQTPEFMRIQKGHEKFEADTFFATGVSIVMHPENPHVPIIHMNVRYFESGDGSDYWFGGGIDLTPHYINVSDGQFFHTSLNKVCNKFNEAYYQKFKSWADDYFFIRHRNETRGIGGIFFDQLKHENESGVKKETVWKFVQEVGNSFVPIYTSIMEMNKEKPFNSEEKKWQMIRRGRYVEFNLVYDRGTKFGLESEGRTESILMSLPPQAEWLYDYKVEKGSPEAKTLEYLKKGINWL